MGAGYAKVQEVVTSYAKPRPQADGKKIFEHRAPAVSRRCVITGQSVIRHFTKYAKTAPPGSALTPAARLRLRGWD